MKRNTLQEDIGSTIPQVQRHWLRIPMALVVSLIALFFILVVGIISTLIESFTTWWTEFAYPNLRGPEKTNENQTK